MEINVNVDPIDINTVIGEKRVYDDDRETYDTEPRTIGDEVVDRLVKSLRAGDGWNELGNRVRAIRDEVIRERIKAEVDDAFEKPIVETNRYGEATGKTTTLTELILSEVNKFLTEKVDHYGKSAYDGTPRVRRYLSEAVDAHFKKEMAETVADEKAKVVAAVRAKAADLIAEAVKQGIGR